MRKIIVHDLMQNGYEYLCTEPVGKNFDPDFKPDLTPKEMLHLGVFGGKYMTDGAKEFPKDPVKNNLNLLILLITLKLTNCIDWSWFYVFLPLIVEPIIYIICILILICIKK